MSGHRLHVESGPGRVRVSFGGRLVFDHSGDKPAFFAGRGDADIEMYRGNFTIERRVSERFAASLAEVAPTDDGADLKFALPGREALVVRLLERDGRLEADFARSDPSLNRFWVRVFAEQDESVHGLGAQFSHFNLRGFNFPLWTSEPGVGRNKSAEITRLADAEGNAGGDYYHTGFPAPTFVSSRLCLFHVEASSFMDFDFSNAAFHEIEVWQKPERIVVAVADSFPGLMSEVRDLLGPHPPVPEWVADGIILGIQGGSLVLDEKIGRALDAGVRVAGAWCQDWAGVRVTSFGKRLRWDWRADESLYPSLLEKTSELAARGVRFLSYINPYLASDGALFKEARDAGHLVRDKSGGPLLADFGEFQGGTVDLSSPEACAWYKGVIERNMIDTGAAGWMADFGEYLPADCALADGSDPMLAHNLWPALWARLNFEALEESGMLGEALVFMRAGFTGSQRHAVSLWAGDQCVDWSQDDGLPSVIPASLSSSLIGCGITHSDIGGYTTLFGLRRSRELFLRWLEMAAFTPIMRTHEGNRPADNHQYDSDEHTLREVARWSRVHAELGPYIKSVIAECVENGLPAQRPLFMHYPGEARSFAEGYEYLLGQDILVAPVLAPGASRFRAWLPDDRWVHLWSGKEYGGGEREVDAGLGRPPVFVRAGSGLLTDGVAERLREVVNRD